jgi:hypothetical protein
MILAKMPFKPSLHPTVFRGFQRIRPDDSRQSNSLRLTPAPHFVDSAGRCWTQSKRLPEEPFLFSISCKSGRLKTDTRRVGGAREAQGCRAAMPQTQISPGILNEPSFRRSNQFVSFCLKLLNRDLAAGVGLQVGIELIVLLHGGFPICAYTRADF